MHPTPTESTSIRYCLKQFLSITTFLFISSISLFAQQNKVELELIEEEALFIGGLSTNVLTQGNVEINFYSALFSNQVTLHESALTESPVRDRFRLTDFTTNVDVYLGVTRKGRFDLGARFKYARRRIDNNARISPFKVFGSGDSEAAFGRDQTFSGLREVGLRFRLIPIESIPDFTITGGYAFSPRNGEQEDVRSLGADRDLIDLNLSYIATLNNNSYYYFILSNTAAPNSFISISQEWLYNTNFSFIVVQLFANRKIALYPGITYNIGYKPPFRGDKTLIKTNDQVLATLGIQFQPTNDFGLNISTALPLLLETTNKLFQPVRESFSFISIGGRWTF